MEDGLGPVPGGELVTKPATGLDAARTEQERDEEPDRDERD
jgi:hypothetical protein